MAQLNLFGEHFDEQTLQKISRKRAEVFNDYEGFTAKFEAKKTTDDCYTPQAVYDAVLGFVRKHWDIEGADIIRPFYPGGDYVAANYPPDCVVVDNPPFSILSRITRFYCANNIRFFLFAPSLTLFNIGVGEDLTYIIPHSQIIYENGASVVTAFITNLPSEYRIICSPELKKATDGAQPREDKAKRGFVYPLNIVTAAKLQYITSHNTEFKVLKTDCEHIRDSDSCRAQGRSLFGGGFLISERAAAERAAAERAAAERAAAERAAATKLTLSDREKAIIARLSQPKKTDNDQPE